MLPCKSNFGGFYLPIHCQARHKGFWKMPIGSLAPRLYGTRSLVVLNTFVTTVVCTIYAFNFLVFQDDMRTVGNSIWRLRKQLEFVQNGGASKSLHNPGIPTFEEQLSNTGKIDKAWKISKLMHMWENNLILGGRKNMSKGSTVPPAPHIVDCEALEAMYEQFDKRDLFGQRPKWPLWKGHLHWHSSWNENGDIENGESLLGNNERLIMGPYPPWIEGADEDNLPMTRRVQRDLWIHQHPKDNCKSHTTKYFLVDWNNDEHLGIGAQLNWILGIFSLAIQDNRIFVMRNFNRANHLGCIGENQLEWSCYFHSETSSECRARVLELESDDNAWNWGYLANTTTMETTWMDEWISSAPKNWGEPWSYMQPTNDIKKLLFVHHNESSRLWWRAQALRYLMRFPTIYMCSLMNKACHEAFGFEAATLVVKTLPNNWPNETTSSENGGIETFLWTSAKPWIPRPILSIHVRIGDKGKEMQLYPFKVYMELAKRVRKKFPDVHEVWLSSEMQSVIESSKHYNHNWTFYYTNVQRQKGHMSMKEYEKILGRETSTNNAFVNLLMASNADFFVGALGSTWCTIIDSLRSTGGKIMAGYLSVNEDRTWKW